MALRKLHFVLESWTFMLSCDLFVIFKAISEITLTVYPDQLVVD